MKCPDSFVMPAKEHEVHLHFNQTTVPMVIQDVSKVTEVRHFQIYRFLRFSYFFMVFIFRVIFHGLFLEIALGKVPQIRVIWYFIFKEDWNNLILFLLNLFIQSSYFILFRLSSFINCANLHFSSYRARYSKIVARSWI